MADANDANDDLAEGWVKMQDQYGDYYINLYNKQTSRIKPVKASVFEHGSLPPPPPAPNDDDDDDDDNLDQPASPRQVPLSPNSQQQATQQQMWNQQLYQQQWQAYYAQQQYMQQQQWAAQQQQMAMQQQQMGMQQQNPQMQQYNPQQMNPQQQQQYMQQQNQQFQQNNNNNNNDDESSSSSGSDGDSGSSTGSDNNNEDEKLQQQQQVQPQSIQENNGVLQQSPLISQNNGIKPKEVPPINNNSDNNNNNNNNNNNPKYAFQPIMPPSMNMNASNDSFRTGSISQKVDISPIISQNNSVIQPSPIISQNNSSVNPSPAFNPNKLSQLAANADFGIHNNLPPAQEPEQPDEGTNMINNMNEAIPAVYASQNNSNNNPLLNNESDIAAPAPIIDKQGSSIFGVMLQQADKQKHLQEEANWEMLLDGVEQNCPVTDRYDVLKAMKKVTKNLLIDDEKYQKLYADNDMVQKKILGRVGGYEFLRGLGFKQGMDDNELICKHPDQYVLKLAIDSLQKRINVLKNSRQQWDPKYRFGKKKRIIPKNNIPIQQNNNKPNDIDDEERQLQEALRLSEQAHIQDMLLRQQRELDFAKQTKSVNIYNKIDEDDQKKSWE